MFARTKPVSKVMLGFAVILVLGFAGAWFAQTETFKLATTHQPERFTELYFEDATKVPETLDPTKTYTQAFTIVNHEASSYDYLYQITVLDASGLHEYPVVLVSVEDGQRVTRQFTYGTATSKDEVVVTVKLLNKDQSVRFRTKS